MEKLDLAQHLINRVRQAYQVVKRQIPNGEVYLFGSYAKRKVKPTSDLDLLVLLEDNLDKKIIRNLKWEIEEKIEETLAFEVEIDLKIYSRSHFDEARQYLGFEAEISKYMIKLEEDLWR